MNMILTLIHLSIEGQRHLKVLQKRERLWQKLYGQVRIKPNTDLQIWPNHVIIRYRGKSIMKFYGSLTNRLLENCNNTIGVSVGMGATIISYSDRLAATVI